MDQLDGKTLQEYMLKMNMDQSAAQKFLNSYISLKELADEFNTPLIEYVRTQLEKSMKQHGVKILEQHNPDPEYSIKCSACGEPIDLHRVYFHVHNQVWKTLTDIVKKWFASNTAIEKGAKR